MQLEKKYYRLDEAAKMLSVSPDDLIHLAGQSQIKLHVLVPNGYSAAPRWYKSDDFFCEGRNLALPEDGLPRGLPIDGPIKVESGEWRKYESDPKDAKFTIISSDYQEGSAFHKPPPGIDFFGWDILDSEWNYSEVNVIDCKIIILRDELNRLGGVRCAKPLREYWESYPADSILAFGDRLEHYLRFKTWDVDLAIWLLAGIAPETYYVLGEKQFYMFDGLSINKNNRDEIIGAMEDMKELYQSDPDNAGRMSVAEWIEWSEVNKISVPWVQWAEKRNLLSRHETANSETPSQRRDRIKKYVNDAYAAGETKESAYGRLAKIEGCGIENIKRIYKS